MNSAKQFFLKEDLEEIYLEGTISAEDALLVVQTLNENPSITTLDIKTSLEDMYRSPDPLVPPQSTVAYRKVSLALLESLKGNSKLAVFSYPMLTELFMDDPETLQAWKQSRDIIAKNLKEMEELKQQ